jgi:hypothetical protein
MNEFTNQVDNCTFVLPCFLTKGLEVHTTRTRHDYSQEMGRQIAVSKRATRIIRKRKVENEGQPVGDSR